MILLDTHCLLWMTGNDPLLGGHSRVLVETARAGGELAVSAISFWEIALLASKRRLELEEAPATLRRELLDTGVIETSLTGEIAILAAELKNLHGDPADRFIVATAIAHGATLITADRELLRWRHKLPRQNATK